MENPTATNQTAKPMSAEQSKQAVFKDICAKWGKFSEQEVKALKGKADLVSQLVAKYGLEQAQAQREVDALLKGRQIGAGA
jgi:hypothetical protein